VTTEQPTPSPAPLWLRARLEQEAERMEREGLIRQYRDKQGRLCWAITEKGRRRLGEEPPPGDNA
jgi:DNA-binding MarR family transcriptional regulator